MESEEDKGDVLSNLSRLELSILRDLYRNRSTKKIAKNLNIDHEAIKEALSDLSSKGYAKYNVGILKDRYKLTEKGFNTLMEKDASVRRSVTSGNPLHEDEPVFKEYRTDDRKEEKKNRKLIRKLKREG
ncbi:MAG: hypothetical protein R6U44_01120 [Archaeoglobaceae archaeon]